MLFVLAAIFFFLLAATLLISFHEFGHFFVARCLKIKVLRFSIGFGKPLLRWKDKHQTEYVIAALPLGGYVKMLDQREGPVATSELSEAFDQQSVWKRILVIMAGPLANLILAVLLYATVFTIGIADVVPLIGQVLPDSLAARAGLPINQEIVAVDHRPTPGWSSVYLALLDRIGESGNIVFTVQDPKTQRSNVFFLPIQRWALEPGAPSLLMSLGILPYIPAIPLTVGNVAAGSPAERAGIRVGDILVALDGRVLRNWQAFTEQLMRHEEGAVRLTVKRGAEQKQFVIVPELLEQKHPYQPRVYLGLQSETLEWPADLQRLIQYPFLDAWLPALQRTGFMLKINFEIIGKMLVGRVSFENLSSIIGIAESAAYTAEMGLAHFLGFLAILSVSLAVINLLPIPLLDGGHLFFCIIEAIRGKPLALKWQLLAFRFGVVLLVGLMLLAVYNDLTRLLG